MVGLSIILESSSSSRKAAAASNPQVINKSTMIKHPNLRWNSPAAGFLNHCFFCFQKLLPGKDIYMYKGDRAFCSVDCRANQIVMDEEEMTPAVYQRDNCSLVAMKDTYSSPSRNRRGGGGGGGKNGTNNGFAY